MQAVVSIGFVLLLFGSACFWLGWSVQPASDPPPEACEAQVAEHEQRCERLLEGYARLNSRAQTSCQLRIWRAQGRWFGDQGE
jgi:hypothetical protein